MTTNAMAVGVNRTAPMSGNHVFLHGWCYIGVAVLAMQYVAHPSVRLGGAFCMLVGLLLFNSIERLTVLVAIVILISPPLARGVDFSTYDAFFGNILPSVSVSTCEILFTFNFLLTVLGDRLPKKRSGLDVLIPLFGIAVVFGFAHGLAVKANASRLVLMEVRPFAGLFLAYFTARLCTGTAMRSRQLWDTVFLATLLKCFQGFYLLYLGTGLSYKGSVRVFSDAELLFMAICFIMGLVDQLERVRIRQLASLTVINVFLVLSAVRFIWVVTSLAAVAILLFQRRRARAVLFLAVLLPVGIYAALATGTAEGLVSRLASMVSVESDITNRARLVETRNAWHAIRSEPILGIGLGGEWIPRENVFLGEGPFRASVFQVMTLVHNTYLWTWLKLGLAGIGLLLAIVVHSFHSAVRSVRQCSREEGKYAWGVLAGVGAFYVILFVGNWFLHPRCMIAWGLLLASADAWGAAPWPHRRPT